MKLKKITTALAGLALSASAALADGPVVLTAVGTWSSLTNFKNMKSHFSTPASTPLQAGIS